MVPEVTVSGFGDNMLLIMCGLIWELLLGLPDALKKKLGTGLVWGL